MSFWDRIVNWAGGIFGEAEDVVHEPLIPIKQYMQEVVPGILWRGSWPTPEMLDQLKAKGIYSVVNLCQERTQDREVWEHKLLSFNISVRDNGVLSPEQKQYLFNLFARYVPLYIHCEEGIGRTSLGVALYRVAVQKWTPEEALKEAESYGLFIPEQKQWILQLKTGTVPAPPVAL